MESEEASVLLYYCYKEVADVGIVVEEQRAVCERLAIVGRIRVAKEGINGTISGGNKALKGYQRVTEVRFPGLDWKSSPMVDGKAPFEGLRVMPVKNLVAASMDAKELSGAAFPREKMAIHLHPKDFHEILVQHDPSDYALLDVRNQYEFDIGHFKGAINPGTRKFTEFERWFKDEGRALVGNKKKVLMYCTGGIRCEKAGIVVRNALKDDVEVFQLHGGIHRYIESFEDTKNTMFQGKNFVFDERVVQPTLNTSIVGKCRYCEDPYDEIRDETRCRKCRMLILVCHRCRQDERGIFCTQHAFLDPRKRTSEIAKERKEALMVRLNTAKGRANSKKRKNARFQLAEIEAVISRLSSKD